MGKYLITKINEYNIESKDLVDFNSFPKDVLKTLRGEYGHHYLHNFDWNMKQDEFIDNPNGFRDWKKDNESEEFIKNLDTLIKKIREDLITVIKTKNAEKALENFEELIIPTLGNDVLVEPLSKYMETALLNLHSAKEIGKAYRDSKNIIEVDGSLNQSNIARSEIFIGDVINLPNFERFVENNPEYKGVFDDWKRLFDLHGELMVTDLNAFRNSTSYENIRKLYDFLIDYRKSN